MRAGGDAGTAAGTALRIDASGLAAKTVGTFGHEGEGMDRAGCDTAATSGAACCNSEEIRCHVGLKIQVALDVLFDDADLFL